MLAPISKYLDWWAIQYVRTALPLSIGQNPRLDEALQFLKSPNFIPAEIQPALIQFDGPLRFHFPTPRPSEFAANNLVHGRLYPSAEPWQQHPTIILLHGGGDFLSHRFRFPLIARRCNQAGFNAATLELPYHFQRRPRGPATAEGPAFPFSTARALSNRNYLRLAESMAQAIAEIRALTGWLLAQGCPAVALWGYSLGGWLAAMTACRDARLASVVLTAPGVRFDTRFGQLILGQHSRNRFLAQSAALEQLNQTPLNTTTTRPAIPTKNILLIEMLHDLIVRKDAVEELYQAWNHPEIWRLPHGHTSGMVIPGLTNRVLQWLAPRMNQSCN